MKRTRLNSMSDKRRKALKGRYVRSTVQASMLVKTGVLDCTKYLKGSAAGRVGRHDEHKPEGQGEGKGRAEKARKANRARLRMRSGCAAPESKTLPAIATGKRVINPARRIKSINRIGSHWKRKPAVIEYSDKRQRCNPGTVEGRREYFNRKMELWERQGGLCCICLKTFELAGPITFEHERGRNKIDERLWVDGKPLNGVSHIFCNQLRGSRKTKIYHYPQLERTA